MKPRKRKPQRERKLQRPTVEELSREEVEFLNKIPVGTFARIHEKQFVKELEAAGVELQNKVAAKCDTHCSTLLVCCHSTCNCALLGW